MPADSFQGQGESLITFGTKWEAISPNDSEDLSRIYKYIVNATDAAGNVVCVDSAGTQTTFHLPAGQALYVRPKRIKNTDTTVTSLIGIIE